MPATEVDLQDYRPFPLRQILFPREIVPLVLFRSLGRIEICDLSAAEMNSGVAT